MKIYLKYGRKYSRPKNISSKFKSPFERKEIRFFLPFGQFPCYWIWIRIPNTDPDLGKPKQYGYLTLEKSHVSENVSARTKRSSFGEKKPLFIAEYKLCLGWST